MYFFRQNNSILYERLTIFLSLWVLWINHPSFGIWPWHLTFDLSPYLCELSELGLSELWQSVGVALLHLTQSHVTDAMTHLTHIQQGRSQRLKKKAKRIIFQTFQEAIFKDIQNYMMSESLVSYITSKSRLIDYISHWNTNLKCGKWYNYMDIDMTMFENV